MWLLSYQGYPPCLGSLRNKISNKKILTEIKVWLRDSHSHLKTKQNGKKHGVDLDIV